MIVKFLKDYPIDNRINYKKGSMYLFDPSHGIVYDYNGGMYFFWFGGECNKDIVKPANFLEKIKFCFWDFWKYYKSSIKRKREEAKNKQNKKN